MSAPVVAYVVAFVLITACILGHLAVSTARQEAHGRHARVLADPADVTDPDGTRFLAELHRQDPPGGYDNSPAATARLLGALRGWATGYDPAGEMRRLIDGPRLGARRPDDTAPIPHAVGTWGKTAPELADEMAAKYLTAEVKR